MTPRVPSVHDRHLVRGWERCRRGLGDVVSDPATRELVLRWIDEKQVELRSPFLTKWRAILTGGEPALQHELERTPTYFELPPERQEEWGRLVQSHPFAPLLARDRASA